MTQTVWTRLGGVALFALLTGCTQTAAPIVTLQSSATPPGPPPQYVRYTVKNGESLSGIASQYQTSYLALAKLNKIPAPYGIAAGEVLMVPNPQIVKAQVAVQANQYGGQAIPLSQQNAIPAQNIMFTPTNSVPTSQPAAAPVPVSLPAVSTNDVVTTAGITWSWPVSGTLTDTFGQGAGLFAKGLEIATAPNAKVLAAADGSVIFSGLGVDGYGTMIIIKSANNFLTAYTNLASSSVKQGQAVKRGNPIAVVGLINAKSILHFEVRLFGTPVDPESYMPPAGS